METKFVDIKTLATRINRPYGTVRHWATHGKIPAKRIGDQWYADLEATERFSLRRPRKNFAKKMTHLSTTPSAQNLLRAIRELPLATLIQLPIAASVVAGWIDDGCPLR